jgi:Na+/H+-translocating membrane pyrophosphatase
MRRGHRRPAVNPAIKITNIIALLLLAILAHS